MLSQGRRPRAHQWLEASDLIEEGDALLGQPPILRGAIGRLESSLKVLPHLSGSAPLKNTLDETATLKGTHRRAELEVGELVLLE
jgi:hypothetical protein